VVSYGGADGARGTCNPCGELRAKELDMEWETMLTIVSGILLAGDHRLGVEQASVGSRSDLVDDVGL